MTVTAVAASGLLTMTDVVVDTNTVVIGGRTYTFQATLTDVDGNVQMGAAGDAEESMLNLLKALNLSGVAGTDYALSMTKNVQVTGISAGVLTLGIQATALGTVGNLITTTETLANGSWGAIVLEDGAGDSGEVAADLDAILEGSTFGINSGVIAALTELSLAMVPTPVIVTS